MKNQLQTLIFFDLFQISVYSIKKKFFKLIEKKKTISFFLLKKNQSDFKFKEYAFLCKKYLTNIPNFKILSFSISSFNFKRL